jgi:hypothetical protein
LKMSEKCEKVRRRVVDVCENIWCGMIYTHNKEELQLFVCSSVTETTLTKETSASYRRMLVSSELLRI